MRLTCDEPTTNRRFESDREALPFPAGGVFGAERTGEAVDLADSISATIDEMQSSLDDLERAMGDELQRELSDVLAHIGDASDWPPAAA